MLSDYFDEYSLNARVRPSLLALLPPTITIYIAFPSLYEFAVGLISLVLLFGLITALAHFVRYRGRVTEVKLYKAWGCKPTTYLLRQSNNIIDSVTKRRYYNYFESNIDGWVTPNSELEVHNPAEADSYYESASRWLLEKTRDKKKFALLFKENVSYGFRRNCLGIKWYGVLLSLVSVVFMSTALLKPELLAIQANPSFIMTSIFVSSVLALWWLALVSPSWVKDSAESYGIRLLASCEDIKST